MTGTRMTRDGLWRCICPLADARALPRAINEGHSNIRPAHPSTWHSQQIVRRQRACTGPIVSGFRLVHGGAGARVGRLGLLGPSSADATATGSNSGDITQDTGPSASDEQHKQQFHVHSLLRARSPYRRELTAAPTSAIYAALRHLQDSPGAFDRIEVFARYLLDERCEAPTAALYEALVRANCHMRGSANAVRDMLQALAAGTIEGTPGLLHGALAVLTIHPDYLLRNAVLQEMKDRWIDISSDGMHSIALGLLRDGQYERALDHLEAMTEASATAGAVPVASWLLDIFIYVLAQEEFLEDALKIVNHRLLRDSDAISLNVWYFLLDACCRCGHYEGLSYVWERAVRPSGGSSGSNGGVGLMSPSDAMAQDVLNMASRHGDANMAATVMQMLAARGTKLSMPHFEAMVDSYAEAGAIDKALQALCIMHSAGIVPDQGSTRSVFLTLVGDELAGRRSGSAAPGMTDAAINSAIDSLFDLKKQYGNVPVAAFNVVVEAMLEHGYRSANASGGTGDGSELALDLYRHVRQLCPAGPNRTTFRILFRRCTNLRHLNFLVHEMRAFSFQPDMDMIDQVVYENSRNGSLEQALRYVFELMGKDSIADQPPSGNANGVDKGEEATFTASSENLRRQPWISRRTAAALAKRCIDDEDDRIWTIADASRQRGRPMDTILKEVAGGLPQMRAARNAYGVPHTVDFEEDDPASPDEATLSG